MTRAPLLLVALALAGCDVEFDPIEPSDLAFSFSGYLDASADTQWVRVEPFGRLDAREPRPIDAVVTLAGPGLEVELEQEVRTFFGTGPAHLFWTTAGLEPDREYRLTARRSDGAEGSVRVAIPDTAGLEVEVEAGPSVCPTRVTVRGAERLVDVVAEYVVPDDRNRRRRRTVSYLEFVEPGADGSLEVSVYQGEDFDAVAPRGAYSAAVVVAIGTPDWPDTVGLPLEDLLRVQPPGLEGAVGFVGGVVTRRFPVPLLSFYCGDTRP